MDCSATELVTLLLQQEGVAVDAVNREQFTPLHAAVWQKQTATAILLIQAGCKLEACASNQSTAVHFAAWHGLSELLQKLLEHGANIGARTRDGDTALHQAVFGNHTRCVMHLLEGYGEAMVAPALNLPSAGTEKFVDAQKADGSTALHLAAKADHVEMVEVLLNAGCTTTLKDRSGLTALEGAQLQQRSRAVLRIRQHAEQQQREQQTAA